MTFILICVLVPVKKITCQSNVGIELQKCVIRHLLKCFEF